MSGEEKAHSGSQSEDEINIQKAAKGIVGGQAGQDVTSVETSVEKFSMAEFAKALLSRAEIPKPESEGEQRHKPWRETINSLATTGMKVAGFIVVINILLSAVEILEDRTSTVDTRKYAENTVALLLGAITGFSVGKIQK